MPRSLYAVFFTLLLLSFLSSPRSAFALVLDDPIDPAPPKGTTPEEIIRKFAAKEKEFKEARDHYTFRQDTTVRTLDGETSTGEFREVVDVTFDDKGRRVESVAYAPQNTLVSVTMTKEDFDDIHHRLPFVLTSDDIGQYQLLYVGQQHIDEIDAYVFDVAPKTLEKGKRYFQGRIWVESHDLQIVKTDGKNVPDVHSKKGEENLTPKFVTYREMIDGKYWFPTYTRADDMLHFSTGDIHIREIVKYTNYKRFGSNVKVTFEGEDVKKAPENPPPTPKNGPPK